MLINLRQQSPNYLTPLSRNNWSPVCGSYIMLHLSVADPDFKLRIGPGSILLAKPAFLPSVISSFFTQNKEGGPGGPGPSPRSATAYSQRDSCKHVIS